MEILECSEKILYFKENGKLVGFCGYSKYNSKKYLLRKTFYKLIKKLLMNSGKIKNKEELKKYSENYEYTPNELKNHFDGEISILIINKDYRGKVIGKKLLFDVFALAKKDKIRNLQILSDESCNYKFYENCGCEIIYQTIVENLEYNNLGKKVTCEKAYIYEKIL